MYFLKVAQMESMNMYFVFVLYWREFILSLLTQRNGGGGGEKKEFVFPICHSYRLWDISFSKHINKTYQEIT